MCRSYNPLIFLAVLSLLAASCDCSKPVDFVDAGDSAFSDSGTALPDSGPVDYLKLPPHDGVTLHDSVRFLFEGVNTWQVGVAPGTLAQSALLSSEAIFFC